MNFSGAGADFRDQKMIEDDLLYSIVSRQLGNKRSSFDLMKGNDAGIVCYQNTGCLSGAAYMSTLLVCLPGGADCTADNAVETGSAGQST